MRYFDAGQLEKLNSDIKNWFEENLKGTKFVFERSQTIPGEEEAIFLWISVNRAAQLRHNKGADVKLGFQQFVEQNKDLAAIDQGGASLQLAVMPKNDVILEGGYRVWVLQHSFHIYAHSWMGYG